MQFISATQNSMKLHQRQTKITFIAYNNKSVSADFHITTLKEVEEILKI